MRSSRERNAATTHPRRCRSSRTMGEFYLMTRKRLRRQVIEFVGVRGFDDPQPPISNHELVWSALPLFSFLGSISLRLEFHGTLYHGLRLFQFLQRGVVDVIFFSRGFSHARLIHFLFDPREKRLVGFLLWLVLMHTRMMSRVQSDYRSIGNRAGSFRIVFGASSFAQSVPICDV